MGDTLEREPLGARTRNLAAGHPGPVQQGNRAPVMHRPRDGQVASEKRLLEAHRAHSRRSCLSGARPAPRLTVLRPWAGAPPKRHPLSPARRIKKFRTGGHNPPQTIMAKANRFLALCMFLGLVSAGSLGHTQEASPNQGVLGDWGGLRTDLYRRGVDFQLGYTLELGYNARGGDDHLLRHADQFNFGATFDLQKLAGWRGAKLQATITDRNGDNLSADANLGTLMQVQEIFGRGNIFRLTQLWYEQAFLDDRLDVKLGRMG